jgi:hypothetical protein
MGRPGALVARAGDGPHGSQPRGSFTATTAKGLLERYSAHSQQGLPLQTTRASYGYYMRQPLSALRTAAPPQSAGFRRRQAQLTSALRSDGASRKVSGRSSDLCAPPTSAMIAMARCWVTDADLPLRRDGLTPLLWGTSAVGMICKWAVRTIRWSCWQVRLWLLWLRSWSSGSRGALGDEEALGSDEGAGRQWLLGGPSLSGLL